MRAIDMHYIIRLCTLCGATILAVTLAIPALAQLLPDQKNTQFIPILSAGNGLYAARGSGIVGGFLDYMTLLNMRDGGVDGYKLVWETCETALTTDRAVACYERLKTKGSKGAPLFHPLSLDIAAALLERASSDKIPLITLGYGRSDAADGRIFPYVFPLLASDWSQTTAQVRYIAQVAGGEEKLQSMSLVNLHLNTPSGKDTLALWEALANKFGFKITHLAVSPPGTEQQALWEQIRQLKPAWVVLRLNGTACTAALREAALVAFPRDHILGNWGCASEEDLIPVSQTATGYRSTSFHSAGPEFPVLKAIIEQVYGQGKGALSSTRVGSAYYNRGVVYGIITTEALHLAYQQFGGGPVGGKEMQWALEHLDLHTARLKALGAEELIPPLKTSCADHEGGGTLRIQQWHGEKWLAVRDWIAPYRDLVRATLAPTAARYARDKHLPTRDCP